jgi:hypothetical protein
MKTTLLLLISFFAFTTTYAQERNKAIYVEGLGSGLLISANYDFRFKPQQDGLGMRIGVGGGNFDGTTVSAGGTRTPASLGIVTVPVLVNYLSGKGRFVFEGGAGLTAVFISTTDVAVSNSIVSSSGGGVTGTLNLGFRAQPIRNGVVFRLNWAPAFNGAGFSPSWFGISLGYGFK